MIYIYVSVEIQKLSFYRYACITNNQSLNQSIYTLIGMLIIKWLRK